MSCLAISELPSARERYELGRRSFRRALYLREQAVESDLYADDWATARDARNRAMPVPPHGYGRRVIDPLIVRRARRNDYLATKADHAKGRAGDAELRDARADYLGEEIGAYSRQYYDFLRSLRRQNAQRDIPVASGSRHCPHCGSFGVHPHCAEIAAAAIRDVNEALQGNGLHVALRNAVSKQSKPKARAALAKAGAL